jgi:hypothetical protein
LFGAVGAFRQLRVTREGQITDRYTKAIDQLDSQKALAVRLGGLYALERIARDSLSDRATIAEVLCTYARTTPRDPPTSSASAPRTEEQPGANVAASAPGTPVSLSVRAPDVQAAVTILGRWQARLREAPSNVDLHDADLQGANLSGARLQEANLSGARLDEANLSQAQLQKAVLSRVVLRKANLRGAKLREANLFQAQLQEAILIRTELQKATLIKAELCEAVLRDAELQGATLTSAKLPGGEPFPGAATGGALGGRRAAGGEPYGRPAPGGDP